MNTLKQMVESRKLVTFTEFKHKELWYTTECGFKFPVPLEDTNGAVFKSTDTALYFVRWINKHIKLLADSKEV